MVRNKTDEFFRNSRFRGLEQLSLKRIMNKLQLDVHEIDKKLSFEENKKILLDKVGMGEISTFRPKLKTESFKDRFKAYYFRGKSKKSINQDMRREAKKTYTWMKLRKCHSRRNVG